MPNVLIRDVDPDDLELIRSAAAAQGVSLQALLRDAVHARAAHLRRREALVRMAERLEGRPAVPAGEREAVLDAIDTAHAERGDRLSDHAAP
ncbi:hypothetical protein [Geodermatophilus sp. TF02-6]|uniref:hypothetical protein n=1 Tax=Geodermatophilus sp. TF02-6 TaxID=2250575 RepID=UPI0011BF942A|nr:hypothetical protein [Geodermatophilus sp. TF02-6]